MLGAKIVPFHFRNGYFEHAEIFFEGVCEIAEPPSEFLYEAFTSISDARKRVRTAHPPWEML